MSLTIESPAAGRLAQELARLTGDTVEAAVEKALAERLTKEREIDRRRRLLQEIQDRVASLPVLDPRSPDEIVGYNDIGAFD